MASRMLCASLITPHPLSSSSSRLPNRLKSFKCKAQSQTVYKGVYGPWSDVKEVRIGDCSRVILFQSLPEEEKKALVKKLEQQEFS